MKHLFSFLLAGCISILVQPGYAQSSEEILLPMYHAGTDAGAVKATAQFWKTFGESKNEKWFPMPNGFLAEFVENNVEVRVVYNKKGGWVYTIRQYTEKELPVEIRKLVKQTYYDETIGLVKEVIQDGYTVYVIHIENEARWKTIRVRDGEMEVVQDFKK